MHKFFAAVVALGTFTLSFTKARAEEPPAPTSGQPTAKVACADQLPAEVDLRPRLLEYGLGPRRQGRRNTCSVFTTAAAMEFAVSRQSGKGTPLSVEYLNWACNQVIHNRTADRGQFFHDLLKGFDQHGICLESEMPYRRRFDPDLEPATEATESARQIAGLGLSVHWINPWKREAGLTDEQVHEIRKVLAAGWPVAAGSGHSRLLVGYVEDAAQPGGGRFYTKDSGSGRFDSVTFEFVKEKVGDVFWVESPVK